MNFFKLSEEMQKQGFPQIPSASQPQINQQFKSPNQNPQNGQTQAQMPNNMQNPNQNSQNGQTQAQMPNGQGTSQPVPPVDQNLVQGMKSFKNVTDPKFQQAFQNFQKQIASLGITLPNL